MFLVILFIKHLLCILTLIGTQENQLFCKLAILRHKDIAVNIITVNDNKKIRRVLEYYSNIINDISYIDRNDIKSFLNNVTTDDIVRSNDDIVRPVLFDLFNNVESTDEFDDVDCYSRIENINRPTLRITPKYKNIFVDGYKENAVDKNILVSTAIENEEFLNLLGAYQNAAVNGEMCNDSINLSNNAFQFTDEEIADMNRLALQMMENGETSCEYDLIGKRRNFNGAEINCECLEGEINKNENRQTVTKPYKTANKNGINSLFISLFLIIMLIVL